MNCPKCGTFNSDDSKFCVGCGAVIGEAAKMATDVFTAQNIENQNQSGSFNHNIDHTTYMSPVQNENRYEPNNTNEDYVSRIKGFFTELLDIMKKPVTGLKKKLSTVNGINDVTFPITIILLLTTILNVFNSMLVAAQPKKMLFIGRTGWNFEALKDVEYFNVILKTFGYSALILLIVATVTYGAGKILKKEGNYAKILMTLAYAYIPMIIGSLLITPVISLINVKIAYAILMALSGYTVALIFIGINLEYQFNDTDEKVYFYGMIYGTLMVIGYFTTMYIIEKMLTSAVTGIFSNLTF